MKRNAYAGAVALCALIALSACAPDAPTNETDLTPIVDNQTSPADECPRADGTACK